jgi:iron complex transport system ATP-binding protein
VDVTGAEVPGHGVEVTGLSFSYGHDGHRLADVSFRVAEGRLCCLLGPNGAGKTTLLRCLLGLLAPAAGAIRIGGRDLARTGPRQLARLVAYVPQATSLPFTFSVIEAVVMGRTPYMGLVSTPTATDRRLALEQLDRLGIGQLAARDFPSLSGGERQLVLMARALVQRAPVLILDEPTASLDYGHEVMVLQLAAGLAREGRTVLMTTHQPAHALAHAHDTILMRDGLLVAQGPPAEVVTARSLSDLYRIPIHVGNLPIPDRPPVRTCVAVPPEEASPPEETSRKD